jgi:hypothetical protein
MNWPRQHTLLSHDRRKRTPPADQLVIRSACHPLGEALTPFGGPCIVQRKVEPVPEGLLRVVDDCGHKAQRSAAGLEKGRF